MSSHLSTIFTKSFFTRFITGYLIGLLLISAFLYSAGHRDPNWGPYWMVKPFLVVPLAGAFGGLFFHFADTLGAQHGWKHFLSIILGLIGFLFILWLGSVFGLNGTYWH
ncbi:MAG: potassium transporter KefB [Saprospiraceae bacterium]